jgi:Holliday junction resolvase RusA-like endonuclease
MKKLTLTVPGIPPSVNHYKKPRNWRCGRGFYLTRDANRFQNTVSILARDRRAQDTVSEWLMAVPERHRRYRVSLTIFLGKGQRGDRDNFRKVPLDALVKAGVIHSDARVVDDPVQLERDWANPRTVIEVEAFDCRGK